MNMTENRYEPISCDYHDLLEAAATRQKEVVLEFDAQGTRQRERGRIGDVYTSRGAEFVRLDGNNGSREIRLDQIVSMREVG
jgi:Rho-binding antiterminator